MHYGHNHRIKLFGGLVDCTHGHDLLRDRETKGEDSLRIEGAAMDSTALPRIAYLVAARAT
jgi:hypothetical protein